MSQLNTIEMTVNLDERYGFTSFFTWTPEDLKILVKIPEAWDGSFYYLAIAMSSENFTVFAFTDYIKRSAMITDLINDEPKSQVYLLPPVDIISDPISRLFVILLPDV